MSSSDTTPKRVRKICGRFPESSEQVAFGNLNFRAANKSFAVFEDAVGGERLIVRTDNPTLKRLLSDSRYFVPGFSTEKQPWVGIHLKDKVEWNEVEILVERSYRSIAAKRMLAELDKEQ